MGNAAGANEVRYMVDHFTIYACPQVPALHPYHDAAYKAPSATLSYPCVLLWVAIPLVGWATWGLCALTLAAVAAGRCCTIVIAMVAQAWQTQPTEYRCAGYNWALRATEHQHITQPQSMTTEKSRHIV